MMSVAEHMCTPLGSVPRTTKQAFLGRTGPEAGTCPTEEEGPGASAKFAEVSRRMGLCHGHECGAQ